MFLSKKHLEQIKLEEFQKGATKGYELGWQLGHIDKRNQDFILKSELQQILKQKEF